MAALQDIKGGLSVNGELVNNLRYADDRVQITHSKEGEKLLTE